MGSSWRHTDSQQSLRSNEFISNPRIESIGSLSPYRNKVTPNKSGETAAESSAHKSNNMKSPYKIIKKVELSQPEEFRYNPSPESSASTRFVSSRGNFGQYHQAN